MRKVWRPFFNILRSKSGEGYIDACVFILIASMALALVVSVFGVEWRKTSVQSCADYAARQIATDGAFSGSTIQSLIRVVGSGHFSIHVRTGDGYDATLPISTANVGLATRKIQQGTVFTVEITSLNNDAIGVGGVESGNVAVYGAANGVSARYWKG